MEEQRAKEKVPVICALHDCVYFEMVDEERRHALCDHPDKKLYLRVEPCPLYRLDWKRRMQQMRGKPRQP